MFQDFEESGDPAQTGERISRLRGEMKRRRLAGFLVPRGDEHMNEYVPPSAERLRWLTGFSGSAGAAVILERKAAIFIDGRYTLQVRDQVDIKIFDALQVPEHSPSGWLKKQLKKGDRIGYDPRLHSVNAVAKLKKAVEAAGASLAPQKTNPVDAIWRDRPGAPAARVVPHPLKFAGESAANKIARLQTALRNAQTGAAILTQPDSIAWAFNIRGGDVAHTPLPLSFAIVHARAKPELFIDPAKLHGRVRTSLGAIARLRKPDILENRLVALGKAKSTVRLNPDTANSWFAETLKRAGAVINHGPDPCVLPKAQKNAAEIKGARLAHARDGVAMCRFLAWLDAEAASGNVDEIAAAEKLERFRADTGKLKDISFDTISGAGANGAIVHYRVTRATNAVLKPGSLYLVDSGAQYADGTTDITRTVAIGTATKDMRRHFTLVLKGHIAIATTRFPKGTRGVDLDAFARRALWAAGLDYDHGTGHGVGSYLSVHEGPANISKRGTVPLKPGMILSNEPGFYRTGKYGIRIENLVLVTEAQKPRGGELDVMGFETLTLAPIDRRLVDVSLLDEGERAWLDAYHARVLKEIGPDLDTRTRQWLKQATAALEKS